MHKVEISIKGTKYKVECLDCGFHAPATSRADAKWLRALHLKAVADRQKPKEING